jgi:phosphogluconate dehydratase
MKLTVVEVTRCIAEAHAHDLGRELFAGMRRNVKGAEEGAISWM